MTASPSSGSSGWSGPKSFLPSLSHRHLWLSPSQSGSDDSRCCDGPKEQAGSSVQGVAAAEHTRPSSCPALALTGSSLVLLPSV